MIYKRYNNKSKLIADANNLQLTNGTEVMIYREDQWHDEVVVDMEEQAEKFEELKPLIVFVAENLCKMDCIAQKYDGDDKFAYGYAPNEQLNLYFEYFPKDVDGDYELWVPVVKSNV